MSRPAGDPPVCECHGEPKKWHADKRHKSLGGYWVCAVKHKESGRRYGASDKGREARRRYEASDKSRQRMLRYYQSEARKRSLLRRIRLNGMYLGMCGFTETELKEMTSGSSD